MPTNYERTIWAQGNGSTLKSYDTSAGKLGGLICWENFMPLVRNAINESGAQRLAAPTWDKGDAWLESMKQVAREGGLFVVSTCMTLHIDDLPEALKAIYPKDQEWISSGQSCIITPFGDIIAGPLEAKEGIILC
jgi:nitrilase